MDNLESEDPVILDTDNSSICTAPNNAITILEQTRLRTTINDLPDEIILQIMSYEFVILGIDMYIYSFPGPAAVCQKWFMIYFEMYWRKWGFLKSRTATMEQWIRLARVRNGIFPVSSPRVLGPSPVEVKPIIIAPKSATPPPAKIPRLIEDTKRETKGQPKSTPIIKPELKSEPTKITQAVSEIVRLNTSDVRAKDPATKETWKTVMKRGRKRSSKSVTAVMGKVEENTPKVRPKAVAFPFKIMRIMA